MEAALNRQVTNESFGSVKNPAYPQIFTVTDLPQFYGWGCQPRLLNIIETYIGLPGQFQGVHLRRDFANESPVTTELWHRDLEDHCMVKIFVYLTDATDEYGPLGYIPKSKVSYWMGRRIQKFIARFPDRLGLTDDEMARLIPRSQWQRCAVPAEAVVFADPIAVFHHGKPRQQERAALFFVCTSAKPLHPEHVTQYHDDSFARPTKLNEVMIAQ